MSKKFFIDILIKNLETGENQIIHQFVHSQRYVPISRKITGLDLLFNKSIEINKNHQNANRQKIINFIKKEDPENGDIKYSWSYCFALWAIAEMKKLNIHHFQLLAFYAYMKKDEKYRRIFCRKSFESKFNHPIHKIIFKPYRFEKIEKMPNMLKTKKYLLGE